MHTTLGQLSQLLCSQSDLVPCKAIHKHCVDASSGDASLGAKRAQLTSFHFDVFHCTRNPTESVR